MEEGYAALAAQIYDSVFLLYTFPDQQIHGALLLKMAFGLAPIDPPLQHAWGLFDSGGEYHRLNGDPMLVPVLKWPRVASLQPTMHWQGFPRYSDRAAASEYMARIDNIRYDLVDAVDKFGRNCVKPVSTSLMTAWSTAHRRRVDRFQCPFLRLVPGAHHQSVPTLPHCSLHSPGVPAASSNNVTSSGNVSSRMAATISGASIVRVTTRLT